MEPSKFIEMASNGGFLLFGEYYNHKIEEYLRANCKEAKRDKSIFDKALMGVASIASMPNIIGVVKYEDGVVIHLGRGKAFVDLVFNKNSAFIIAEELCIETLIENGFVFASPNVELIRDIYNIVNPG